MALNIIWTRQSRQLCPQNLIAPFDPFALADADLAALAERAAYAYKPLGCYLLRFTSYHLTGSVGSDVGQLLNNTTSPTSGRCCASRATLAGKARRTARHPSALDTGAPHRQLLLTFAPPVAAATSLRPARTRSSTAPRAALPTAAFVARRGLYLPIVAVTSCRYSWTTALARYSHLLPTGS